MNHISSDAPLGTSTLVLNAFRHERMNHETVEEKSGRRDDVLNAFRHQRMNHFRRAPRRPCGCGAQRLSASTNESPLIRRGHPMTLRVLNAFRHQRMNHNEGIHRGKWKIECSTPFGINE